MRIPLLLTLTGGALVACGSPSPWQPPPPRLPQAAAPAVLAVVDPGPPALERPPEAPLVAEVRNGADGRTLILGLWSDGRLVWSEDRVFGGPPYHEARVEPERLGGLLRSCGRLFARWDEDVIEYHPRGASHVELSCRVGGMDKRLASWHESFERNPELVVTAGGVEPLEGRDRASVQAGADPDYRRFRVWWNDVRALLRGTLPADAPPAEPGPLPLPAPR